MSRGEGRGGWGERKTEEEGKVEWERTVRHSDLSLLGARTNNGHNRVSSPPMTFFHTLL